MILYTHTGTLLSKQTTQNPTNLMKLLTNGVLKLNSL